jgi:hypothetical protein
MLLREYCTIEAEVMEAESQRQVHPSFNIMSSTPQTPAHAGFHLPPQQYPHQNYFYPSHPYQQNHLAPEFQRDNLLQQTPVEIVTPGISSRKKSKSKKSDKNEKEDSGEDENNFIIRNEATSKRKKSDTLKTKKSRKVNKEGNPNKAEGNLLGKRKSMDLTKEMKKGNFLHFLSFNRKC